MTPRALHPAAWWCWGILVGAAAVRISNPLLSGILIAGIWLVVAARRRDVPWARSFGRFLRLGVFVLGVRLVLQAFFAPRLPGHVLLTIPEVDLPSWAAGVRLGGAVTAEALLSAAYDSLRLIGLLAAIGAANSLADPYRLLRALPRSLHETGVALAVALSLAPQASIAAAEVRDARRLRGRPTRGLHAIRGVALPVLEGALERSVTMAASMDSRGFGRQGEADPVRVRRARIASAAGFVALAIGTYGVLDGGTPSALGPVGLVGGAALFAAALSLGGARSDRARYRPDPWSTPEWITVACGASVLGLLVMAGRAGVSLSAQVAPLALPGLPLVPAVAALLVIVPALPELRAERPSRAGNRR